MEELFVGFFIGSPGMNLMPVTRSGDGVRFGDTDIPLSDELRQQLAGLATDNLKLGIRPEFVELAEPGQGALGTGMLLKFCLATRIAA